MFIIDQMHTLRAAGSSVQEAQNTTLTDMIDYSQDAITPAEGRRIVTEAKQPMIHITQAEAASVPMQNIAAFKSSVQAKMLAMPRSIAKLALQTIYEQSTALESAARYEVYSVDLPAINEAWSIGDVKSLQTLRQHLDMVEADNFRPPAPQPMPPPSAPFYFAQPDPPSGWPPALPSMPALPLMPTLPLTQHLSH